MSFTGLASSWAISPGRRASFCSGPRLKVLCVVAVCLLLGYSMLSLVAQDVRIRTAQSHSGIISAQSHDMSGLISEEVLNGVESRPPERLKWGAGSMSSWRNKLSALNPWRGSAYNSTISGAGPDRTELNAPSGGTDKPNITDITIYPGNQPSLGSRARIAKVTILVGDPNPVYERALLTHERHDRMHNYPLRLLRERMLDDVWSKPAYMMFLIMEEMAKPYGDRLKWLLWFDADTIILNPRVPIETFLPPQGVFDDVHMVVTHDWNGLNNGVFPIRVCEWSIELFAAILSFRFYRPDSPLVFRDQSAMAEVIREPKFARHIVQAPQRWFNAYQGELNETLQPHQVRRGDFLVHFTSVGDRNARMRPWLERAEMHAPDWEVSLEHTSYPSETREFWASVARQREEDSALARTKALNLTDLMNLVRKRLDTHRAKLSPAQAELIDTRLEESSKAVEHQHNDPDLREITKAMEELKSALSPLDEFADESQRELTKEAHKIIFAAEQSALAEGLPDSAREEAKKLLEDIARLKESMLEPQWRGADIQAKVDELRSAYLRLGGSVEQEKGKEKEKEREKELEREKEREREKARLETDIVA